MYSVSTYDPDKKGWRVIRTDDGEQVFFGKVVLIDAVFKVSQAGRERAIREGKRNVHAWVEGNLVDYASEPEAPSVPCGRSIYYNPFKTKYFTTLGDEAAQPHYVESAGMVSLGISPNALTNKPQADIIAKKIKTMKEEA
jgi:hypothetical protein